MMIPTKATLAEMDYAAQGIAEDALRPLIPDRVILGPGVRYDCISPEEGKPELRGAWISAKVWVDSRERPTPRQGFLNIGADILPTLQEMAGEGWHQDAELAEVPSALDLQRFELSLIYGALIKEGGEDCERLAGRVFDMIEKARS